jgi:hypothetical protein
MRSTLIILGLLLLGGLWAQKPAGGTATAEVGLQGAINNIAISPIGGARLRYFLGDNLAVRLGLNLQNGSQTNKDYENPDGTGGVGEEKHSYFYFGFRPGVEYHFAGGEKLSTFAGAQLILDFASAKTTRTNYLAGNYVANYSQTVEGQSALGRRGTTFGIGFYSGFDWYFIEKVYLGIEWGLNFASTSEGDVTTTTSFGGTTQVTKAAGNRDGGLGVGAIALLRLGYQF